MQNSLDFDGLGMVTFLNPSDGDCRFLVGVTDVSSLSFRPICRWLLWCFDPVGDFGFL